MRRILSFVTVCLFLVPSFAFAAIVQSGDLIKASGQTVYYVGADGKRYVFPTEKTYFSWYADFSGVKTISDGELASYALGGNVTYRPGTKLVKITTDPKVYAVDKKGTLRWLADESIAKTLYGNDWPKKVDDLPDAFFVNYSVGAAIATAQDFSPTTVTTDAISINSDRAIAGSTATTSPPTPAPSVPAEPTYGVSLAASQQTPSPSDVIRLTALASPSNDIKQVNIYFNNILITSCASANCAVDERVPGTAGPYEIRTFVTWNNGKTASAAGTVTVTPMVSDAITMTIGAIEISPNKQRDVRVIMDSQKFSAHTIEIYLDGAMVKGCTDAIECRYTEYETSPIGTVHSVYAVAKNYAADARTTPIQTISVVEHPHPVVTLTVGKNLIYKNETVDMLAQASDDAGVSWTEIWADTALLKHCSGSVCTLIAGPWNASRTVNFIAKSQNSLGLSTQTATIIVTVQ